MLPIDFEETKGGAGNQPEVARRVESGVGQGGVLIIFPGAGVDDAHGAGARAGIRNGKTSRPHDPSGQAPVDDLLCRQNSRLFQVASHVSMTLRLSLLFKEVHDPHRRPAPVRIGKRIPYDELKASRTARR